MSGASDERAVSEGTSIAVLVLLTVLVTASVGVNILFLDGESEGIQANFTFDYRDSSSFLTVTHSSGDDLNSSKLYIEGSDANATWTELAGRNESFTVSQGDIVGLSGDNAYGQRVDARDTIDVVYIAAGNRTLLSTWNGSSEAG